jgi:hypothetical protein
MILLTFRLSTGEEYLGESCTQRVKSTGASKEKLHPLAACWKSPPLGSQNGEELMPHSTLSENFKVKNISIAQRKLHLLFHPFSCKKHRFLVYFNLLTPVVPTLDSHPHGQLGFRSQ